MPFLFIYNAARIEVYKAFRWKSPHAAVNAVQSGEELAKKLNLDGEKLLLKIAAAFDRLT